MKPVIRTRGLCRNYIVGTETVHALRDISLAIERNEYVAIMGPSGSGKSTPMSRRGPRDESYSGTASSRPTRRRGMR